MIWVYQILMTIAIPFGVIGLFVKGFSNRQYWYGWSQRFGLMPADIKHSAPYDLWIHAVSVGEVRAVSPLVKSLLKTNPALKVLLTTTTPTGADTVKMLLGNQVDHCYFPYDLSWAMHRYMRTIHPRLLLVMETEIWPNLIRAAARADIPMLYTNVRLSARSFKRYQRIKSFVSELLAKVDHFAVQGETDRDHLLQLGVDDARISVTGSIKFDVNMPASLHESAQLLRHQLGSSRLVWIAGSTREGEESKLLDVHQRLREVFPDLLLILVPRHPQRFDAVAKLLQKRQFKTERRTQIPLQVEAQTAVYLGDTMGELAIFYAASDVAFVGGSLVAFGGQNILEPCALGVPVLFGPHMFNFVDISRWTLQRGAGLMVQDEQELERQLKELLASPAKRDQMGDCGKALIEAHKGALAKNMELIRPRLLVA